MKKIILTIAVLCLAISCSNTKKLEITKENILNDNLTFIISKNNELLCTTKEGTGIISNIEKFSVLNDYWYAFFNQDDEKNNQLLVVYDLETDTYEYCDFYSETSYFFEDELICFSIKTNPEGLPLPRSYEITTTIKDFRNKFEKTYQEKSRYDTSSIKGVQDFFYRKPYFFENNHPDVKKNILSAIDIKYKGDDKVYYVVWEQAHFPISSYYYYPERKKAGSSCAYPSINDTTLYRTEDDELKPLINSESDNQYIQNNDGEIILATTKAGNYTISIVQTKENSLEYADSLIRITEGEKSIDYRLDMLFPYKDNLEKIELSKGSDEYACLIITTNVFAYDVYINLKTGESDIYLRASSFPNKNRALE